VRLGKPWTAVDDANLKLATNSGVETREICKIMGRSKDSINSRRRKLKIRAQRRRQPREEMIMVWIQRDVVLAFQKRAAAAGVHRVEYVRRILVKVLEDGLYDDAS